MDQKIRKQLSLLIDNLQVSIYFNSHDFSKSQRQLDLIKRDIKMYSQE
jgi:hypothetical protein